MDIKIDILMKQHKENTLMYIKNCLNNKIIQPIDIVRLGLTHMSPIEKRNFIYEENEFETYAESLE